MNSFGYLTLGIAYVGLALQISDYATRVARVHGPFRAGLTLAAGASALTITTLPLLRSLFP